MRPRFFEVTPASRRISAPHGLHNMVTTSMPLYTSFCAPLSMYLPAEEPAQEPAPTVDEATHRPSETVVSAEEHAAAVSPYPYGLQSVQVAPADPVAEASVREELAEVPQPRQWADEGGWDSRVVFMPVSEVVPAAATVAAARRSYGTFLYFLTDLGLAILRLHGEALPRRLRSNSSLFAPGTRSARWARSARRASERKGIRVRGLGVAPIPRAVSDASCGRDSKRSDIGTRAGEGQHSAQLPSRPAPRLRYRRKRGRARSALDGEDGCVVGGALRARCAPDARSPSGGEVAIAIGACLIKMPTRALLSTQSPTAAPTGGKGRGRGIMAFSGNSSDTCHGCLPCQSSFSFVPLFHWLNPAHSERLMSVRSGL
ncbi:hypothetical protein FB451DRAFT_1469222 [Mycena latifolia]|nr:hypothetical protein FB451DRAFT_1469222 [Mycena latifolia]